MLSYNIYTDLCHLFVNDENTKLRSKTNMIHGKLCVGSHSVCVIAFGL